MPFSSDSPALVLAFFRDRDAAIKLLAELRRTRCGRSAAISKSSEGRISVDERDLSNRRLAFVGGASLSLVGAFLPLPRVARLAVAVGGAAAGLAAGQLIDLGVDDKTLKRYREWVMKGETLILVEVGGSNVARALEILRQDEDAPPTTFVSRAPTSAKKTRAPQIGVAMSNREALTIERLKEYAAKLATTHKPRLRAGRTAFQEDGEPLKAASGQPLLRRLQENERLILGVCRSLAEAARLEQAVSLSAEWLLDNAYVIESQIADVRLNLSKRFYNELPQLASVAHNDAPSTVVPRVYALACELIAHTDARLDRGNVCEWLESYQTNSPLTMGELWAMPLMLRLALVENLSLLTAQTDKRQRERERADFWANRLLNAAHYDPDKLLSLLADLSQEQTDLKPHFADRLVSHLYDEEAALVPVQSWLERKLDAPLPEVLQGEQRRQAADQIAVANTITSMRFLTQLDWRDCFESLSVVENVLRQDDEYGRLDFATRDNYRHQVERIARGAKKPEADIARRAVEDAQQTAAQLRAAAGLPEDAVQAAPNEHVGYYLIGEGQLRLEADTQYQAPASRRALMWLFDHPLPVYLGSVAAMTSAVTLGAALLARRAPLPARLALGALSLIPASEAGVQFVNYLATRVLPPRALPKMNFEDGVPQEFRTLVVVPMMLLNESGIREDIDRLEIRYLANHDANLRFALLSDLADAPTQHLPTDEALLNVARQGIDDLNARYEAQMGFKPFLLFGRDRAWSQSEACWMGWERKRGKLEQFNAFVRRSRDVAPDHLHLMRGEISALDGIKFIITLDADTQLPHGTARRMIETLAHPLNRPILSDDAQPVVTSGYGLIQPRVDTSLPSATATRFSRLFTDATGSDPYTHVISDVYQDLFGEGSYHGKGIYDLEAFDKCLSGRFPDATLLSHDLIEGAYVRVGLASDIELLDQFPGTYQAFAKRDHRWIRGDWQIAQWARRYVPAPVSDGSRLQRSPLSTLNRWKIGDNLRRSLLAPATLLLLGIGWTLGPQTAVAASVLASVPLLFPTFTQPIGWLPRPASWALARQELLATIERALANAILLPHQAVIIVDAITRVFYRRFVTHRGLLEWQTAQVASQSADEQKRGFLLQVGVTSLLGVGLGALALLRGTATLGAVAPFASLWLLAPAFAHWIDSVVPETTDVLSEDDQKMLRRVARQTWRYFDDFVGPQNHWLPPDNYQEALRIEIAQRTSPTNIGLWLQCIVAARDFGWLTPDELLGRALPTMESLAELEMYRGHLLNWYDTQNLEPLRPRYVSTVDSGNLLGALWTTDQGVRDVLCAPFVDESVLRGLSDVLGCLQEATEGQPNLLPGDAVGALERLLNEPTHGPIDLIGRLRACVMPVAQVLAGVAAHQKTEKPNPRTQADVVPATSDPRVTVSSVDYWAAQMSDQLENWILSVDRYGRWMELLNTPPDEFLLPLGESGRDLRRAVLQAAPSLENLGRGTITPLNELLEMRTRPELPAPLRGWLEEVQTQVNEARWLSGEALGNGEMLLDRIRKLADEMDMSWLYDPQRKLFTIGFNLDEMRLDSNYYDLIASECRLASFCSIARGDVPVEHWYALGRRFGSVGGQSFLLSWSGTMFEYLMPLLYTRAYENSLLDQGVKGAVARQVEYGRERNVPWGISEAAFSALDNHRIYQYKAFGCPGLGLKRGLEDDLVISPYSTALALSVDPVGATENLKRLEAIGMRGDYGFYESIDFTRERINTDDENLGRGDQPGSIVRAFMVHHQGMSLLAFDNALNGRVMQNRFHANPMVQAAVPLLFERIPSAPPTLDEAMPERGAGHLRLDSAMAAPVERLHTPDTPSPRVQLLSNGNYALMVTNAGGGYSRWRDFDITRWRADTTRDNWGSFFYLRDLDTNSTWTATHQPMRKTARVMNATFKTDRAEFKRRGSDIETFVEIVVSPEDDAEVRKITLVNHGLKTRHLEVTSFMELALAPHAGDRQHPAFQKLFIQTQALPPREDGAQGLVAWRRPRSPKDAPIWAGHLVTSETPGEHVSYETDRAKFLGRARTAENPVAMEGELSNTAGAVLDPVFSLRRRVTLGAGQRIELSFVTVAGESRENVERLIEKYYDPAATRRALDLAWTHAQLEMHHLRIKAEDGQRFQQLAGYMVYPSAQMRAPARRLRENHKGQSGLWAYGISGDLPMMIVTIDNARDLSVVRQALLAQTFWRVRGLKTDLVILNEQGGSYDQTLSETLRKLIGANSPYTGVDQPGGVFLRSNDDIPKDDLTLLLTSARVVVVAARGGLAQQLATNVQGPTLPPRLTISQQPPEEPSAPLPFMELPYFNGLGGFTTDGREYAIYLGPRSVSPAPWSNVFANPNFGAMITESGQGYAWSGNSQSNKLTPWSNDPVSDPSGDAIYIRDDDSGTFWTPTPLPIRENDAYRARHGQGYTLFEHNSHAIEQELLTFVPVDEHGGGAPVRVQRLKLKNRSSRRRRLTVTFFCEWTLGTTKEETQMHVVTNWDAQSGTLLARNAYHPDYANRVAFVSASPTPANFGADRTIFIGRNGTPANPSAMRRKTLTGRAGAGLDACGAVQVQVEIEPNQEAEVSFLLGEADNVDQIRAIVQRFRDPANVEAAFKQTVGFWDELLSTLQVEVPDVAVNFLLNRWLVYQTLSCRIWGRSAFYQSGGAFGFRDQLQDVMALLYARPQEARAHILRATAHQFVEGDVQHWWHEPSGAGVRTRFSDDLLWLPYVINQYVRVTGDAGILDEVVGFIEAPILAPDQHELYLQPQISSQTATLFDHCRRAIEKGSTTGAHGLPLIGIGDWNDGMSRVGEEGRGESVWLAWFLVDTLNGFAELADKRVGDEKKLARTYRARAKKYAASVEAQAWDGEWYVRAFYDDGTPLGSHTRDEAKIDSLGQTWSVICGAGDKERSKTAMQAVEDHLIREDLGIVLLFNPAFDKSDQDPGYIKGYLPGVRENGGQYTHAALWTALAFARMGEGNRAVELLRMLNPTEHARDEAAVETYKVEPYVVAADIYNLPGHIGRGGWTWYTGSASWMYRVWMEDVLGFKKRGDVLTIEPSIPQRWRQFTLRYRFGGTRYEIIVQNPDGVQSGVLHIEMDDKLLPKKQIPLKDDGLNHSIRVRMGEPRLPQLKPETNGATPQSEPLAPVVVEAVASMEDAGQDVSAGEASARNDSVE